MADTPSTTTKRATRPPFNWIARDLDRALTLAGFNQAERTILMAARELSYGLAQMRQLPDPLPFKLNLSALSRDSGAKRDNLRAARERLVACAVLIATPDGLFINKRYDQWSGARALGRAKLEAARRALNPSAIHDYDGLDRPLGSASDDAAPGPVEGHPPGPVEGHPPGPVEGHPPGPVEGHPPVPPPITPPCERARRDTGETEERQEIGGGLSRTHASASHADAGATHAREAEPGPIADRLSEGEAETLGREVLGLTRDAFCQAEAIGAAREGRWARAWIVEAAAAVRDARPRPRNPWKFMQAILFRFVAQGGSDSEVKLCAARAEAEADVGAGGPALPIRPWASPAATAYPTATERRLAARQEKIDAMRRRGEERRREDRGGGAR